MLSHSGNTNIVIFGLGLIGGSLAAVWSQAGYRVLGVSPSEDSRNRAMANGWVYDAIATPPAQWDPDTWLVLCGPLSINRQLLGDMASGVMATQDIWVTDVGSCKRQIGELAEQLVPGRFIGGHPLAGKAQGGIAHAEPSLFQDRPYVLCANSQVTSGAQAALAGLVQKTGAVLKWMSATEHDRMMAWVSHFPQVYSVLLANQLQQHFPQAINSNELLFGPALAEHLRLAGSPVHVWQDILSENADNVQRVLETMAKAYQEASILDDWSGCFSDANQTAEQLFLK